MTVHSPPGCSCPTCQALASYAQVALQSQAITPSCPPAPQVLPREIVAAPVEGWRIWQVYPQFAQLGAVGIGPVRWDRVERARCCGARHFFELHSAPDALCGCGLWAFKDFGSLQATLRGYAGSNMSVYGYGRVQLWGKIIECERGWRGEYARPLQVTLLGVDDTTAQAIREFYGCEVIVEDVPEWLHVERAKTLRLAQWNAKTQLWTRPGTFSNPPPPKRRRSFVGPLLALLCLAFAVINAVVVYLDAFVSHNGHAPLNAMAALATVVVFCMYWDLP